MKAEGRGAGAGEGKDRREGVASAISEEEDRDANDQDAGCCREDQTTTTLHFIQTLTWISLPSSAHPSYLALSNTQGYAGFSRVFVSSYNPVNRRASQELEETLSHNKLRRVYRLIRQYGRVRLARLDRDQPDSSATQ